MKTKWGRETIELQGLTNLKFRKLIYSWFKQKTYVSVFIVIWRFIVNVQLLFYSPLSPQVNLFLSNVQRKVYHKEVIFAFIFNICFIEWMRSWDILESLERLSRKFFESDLINWKELLVISNIFSCLVIDQHNSNKWNNTW